MANIVSPKSTEGQNPTKARDILNGMALHRIDPTRIKTTDTAKCTRGGQGVVIVGTLSPPETVKEWLPEVKVAVKNLEWNRDDAGESAEFFKSFANELSLMVNLVHENVIRLIGFVEDMEKGDAWIVLPWEANGNVREFLQSGEWDIPERISLIQDVAKGLEYLHTRDPPICHGDLKSLNILVNSSYRAVITDFGSARIKRSVGSEMQKNGSEITRQVPADDDRTARLLPIQVKFEPSTLDLTLTGPKFSLRWTAPEILRDGMQDLASDMWSIGWICWEIITDRVPFDELDHEAAIILHTIHGRLPAIQKEAQLSHVLMLCGLMSECWALQPAERIDASTFKRKFCIMPSETPSGWTSDGQKARSAHLLIELGRMYHYQKDTENAESHYLSAIDIATRTKDDAAKAIALYCLGTVCYGKKAEDSFKEAQEISSRIGSSLGVANSLNGLGKLYHHQSKYHEAEVAFNNARAIHSQIGNDLGIANALENLGDNYHAQSKEREAEKAFNNAREIQSRIGNDLGAAAALVGLGSVYDDQSRYHEAEEAFVEAFEIYSRIGNSSGARAASVGLEKTQSKNKEAEKTFNDNAESVGTANALQGPGQINDTQSKYGDAEKASHGVRKIHSRMGNDSGAASSLVNLEKTYIAQSKNGDVEKAFTGAYETENDLVAANVFTAKALFHIGVAYFMQSKHREAQKALNGAHELHLRISDDMGAFKSLLFLGHTYRALLRNGEAEKAFRGAREMCSRMYAGSDLGVAYALDGLGEVYLNQSRNAEAERAFMEAYEIQSRMSHDSGAAHALLGLAKTHAAQSRILGAEKALNEARDIYSGIGSDPDLADALYSLGEMYRNQLQFREAEEAFNEAHEMHLHAGNLLGTANSLLCLGLTHLEQSRNREAEEALVAAHEIHSRTGNDLGAKHASDGLEEIYRAQARSREAEGALNEAGEIHSRIDRDLGTPNTLLNLGNAYRTESRNQETQNAFKQPHEIRSQIGNELDAADDLKGLGEIHPAQSRHRDVEEAFNNARKINLPICNKYYCAGTVFRNLGIHYSRRGQSDEAELSYHQALTSCDCGESDIRAETLFTLAVLFHTQQREFEAEESINEALAIYISTDHVEGQATASMMLSTILKSQSNHSEEMDTLIQAEALFARTDNDSARGVTLLALGDNYRTQHKYTEAEECYNLAQTIYLSLDEAILEADALVCLGHLYVHQGRLGEAEECFARTRVHCAAILDEAREAAALDGLMEVYVMQGRFEDARVACKEAFEIYARTGRPTSETFAKTWELVQE
ncbi:hypothetical protein M407DRAFT_26501 [Tulasnella calospora MUT 4182]|uniref:Protein kinase domain-containing protein n=1 Tax=Tulasnella calospora MUT 4182 TaxID=1051891 RepID=A0A0C3QE45_9AGAM|nr:hypothetical protein M407DRAFT_26501 [Tulasnella calospora MUT 4182]